MFKIYFLNNRCLMNFLPYFALMRYRHISSAAFFFIGFGRKQQWDPPSPGEHSFPACTRPPCLPPAWAQLEHVSKAALLKKKRESTGCEQKTKTHSAKSTRPFVKLLKKRNSIGGFKNRLLPQTTA